MSTASLIETFPALSPLEGLVHGFTLRHPDIDVKTDREVAIARLEQHFCDCLSELGISREHVATGEQVHGKNVARVAGEELPGRPHFPETDGLMTNVPGQFLGIFVADCGAVFIVDPVKQACAALHSGKNGTALGIAPEAIQKMQAEYGSNPADLIVQLAPCIRPPAYEIDFAAQILTDSVAAGVPESQVHDCGTCTSTDLDRYYSYRVEMGKTGRLFAVIGWEA
ncbi:MAG: polyphenol oxidase family protein [Verrucomicrobiales bacterium]|nr:polyphenol oxidase family protein [Verrucomicrobiales bacterium]